MAIGCLGIMGLGVLVSLFGGSGSSSSSRAASVAIPAPRDTLAERRADSVRVAQILRAPSAEADFITADRLIHRRKFTIAHDSVHVRAVDLYLDSAEFHLKPNKDGWGATALATPYLQAAVDPLTTRQSARLKRLATTRDAQDRRIKAAAEKIAEDLVIRRRKEMARQLEVSYLDKGLDVRVTTAGAKATTLKLEWILVSRVLAHQMSKEAGLFDGLRAAGFKKFVITDGYDETWYWDL